MVRAKIVVTEEVKSGRFPVYAEAEMANGKVDEISLRSGNSQSLKLRGVSQLVRMRDAINELLKAIKKAENRFEWADVSYIEEDGVRIV